MSSVGVVIPCHKPYISLLKECLDSIELQTSKPDKVIVMCSSSLPEDIPQYNYSFPLEIVTREGVHNQANNRNEGVKRMNTDIVSFFDADDVMHPQRIEMIRKYMIDQDILFHGFQTDNREFEHITSQIVHYGQLVRGPTGCVVFRPNWQKMLHHAQISVRRHLFDFVKFPENPQLRGSEDSLLCGMIVSMSHIRNVFIENSLSWYRLRSE